MDKPGMSLGDYASIATLILFVFYFIGRIIIIVRNRNIFLDEIKILDVDCEGGRLDIVESFELENEPYNSFILTSKNGIYNLSVYKIIYDDELSRLGREKLMDCKYKFLNSGQSLAFSLTVSDVLPTYEVEYFTPDYKKITIELWDNPKNGVMSESVRPKNTFRSIMFHIFY